MEWVERAPMHGPAFVLPRSGGQPVFVDPHGHRVRRLRHGARIVAGAAAVYLALLALGLAGPAAPPFSLFPGAGAKAGERGTEAVHAGSGPAASADRAADANAGGGSVLGGQPTGAVPGAAPAVAPGTTGADPATQGVTPVPGGAAPAAGAPGNAPAAAPAGRQAPAPSKAAPAPSGRSGPPAGSAPGTTPSATPGHGPPAGHAPPGQAKKADAAPGPGNGNGNGNGPPDNHGQQMAAQHSHSPNR